MKIYLTILLFLIFQQERPSLIINSNGIDKICIGDKNLKEVKLKFKHGLIIKNKREVMNLSALSRTQDGSREFIVKKIIPQTTIYYSDIDGFKFIFSEKILSQIEFTLPALVKTDKGIELNNTTFKEVDSIYGKSDWYLTENRFAKNYNNLIFLSEIKGSEAYSDTVRVKKIIIKKDGYRYIY